jgi:integrase
MGTDYNHEIGYETLQKDFKRYQKETPKGVSLQNKRNKTIVLKFKISGEEKSKGCNCSFTLDGMVDALGKANKVAEKLKTCSSTVEFDQWYNEHILKKNKIVDDRMTFIQSIAKVYDDFWSRPDRRKRKRDKDNPSDISSWSDTYGRFYKHLPEYKTLNLADMQTVIDKWNKGTKTYAGVVSAMKKLVSINHRQDIHDRLSELDVSQTEYKELQSVNLEDFLNWRDATLGVTQSLHVNSKLEVRKAWLWVFSIQVTYGLRIHEVFAIANAFEPYVTKDKVTIPALNDQENKENILVLKGETLIGTTTKTGYRLARPQIPPKYPDLVGRLDIKNPMFPMNKPVKGSSKAVANFYNNRAWKKLKQWNAPTTETHAFRHLANINGMQAGIPLEIRAQSMGHTPAMNDSTYKKRQSTQTTLDLYNNSNQNAIDFVTALAEAKKLVKTQPEYQNIIAQLLSIIYQKNHSEISSLLV